MHHFWAIRRRASHSGQSLSARAGLHGADGPGVAKSVILRPFFRKIRHMQQYPLCAGLACCYVHVYSMSAVEAAPDIGKPVKRTAFQQALCKRVPYPKNEGLVAERSCYSRASFPEKLRKEGCHRAALVFSSAAIRERARQAV